MLANEMFLVVCICVYVCMYVCIYIYIYIYIYKKHTEFYNTSVFLTKEYSLQSLFTYQRL